MACILAAAGLAYAGFAARELIVLDGARAYSVRPTGPLRWALRNLPLALVSPALSVLFAAAICLVPRKHWDDLNHSDDEWGRY